ncbi:hypothetical protein RB620_02145 [Paenibacillus sp. LHD-117]|uniref:hypothetical protein n=1 Tax=Paenibacillus sp. LHD-117 TaxID=3071412 RepID=UPI0027E15E23|nr:hypothetical protein [Paenibacillus sp. LHD-117]MDQ6418229.1 hypothetical protein [Paenibacillus sp. LHD-117]
MDKLKVIAAYRRGFITIQECAQIIGVDSKQINRLVNDPKLAAPEMTRLEGQSV